MINITCSRGGTGTGTVVRSRRDEAVLDQWAGDGVPSCGCASHVKAAKTNRQDYVCLATNAEGAGCGVDTRGACGVQDQQPAHSFWAD